MSILADAIEHTLQEVYCAENATAEALPKAISGRPLVAAKLSSTMRFTLRDIT